MRALICVLLSALTVTFFQPPPAHARADGNLPRYDLPVGRVLVFESKSESKPTKAESSGFSSKVTTRITVVRANPDGSRRLIVRSASRFGSIPEEQSEANAPERVELQYADLFPDGRALPNPTTGMFSQVSNLFPALPKDPAEGTNGWTSVNEARLQTTAFKPQSATEQAFVFTATEDGMVNKIYLMTDRRTCHLDRAKGVITKVEGEQSQDYGFHNKGTSLTTLTTDEMLPADEPAEMAGEFEQLFAAKEAYGKLTGRIEREPKEADRLLAEARSVIASARDGARREDVKPEFETLLKDHDQYAQYAKQSAARFEGVLQRPAADWESTDLAGRAAKMADYRGKVVVMDFWYRGCGWCMYAMPQVKQLADDFKDEPVVVLGMNTDEDVKDAQTVIDVMGLSYPTIRAKGIPEKYGVQGFPTLVVIDQRGVVRDVHVGYSPKLRDDVGRSVRELLAKGPAEGGK